MYGRPVPAIASQRNATGLMLVSVEPLVIDVGEREELAAIRNCPQRKLAKDHDYSTG